MSRYTPQRAGIIGLWDYADEEFVFADGWLVLRGPNGSGKTKVLELLFPFLLDGSIDSRRLNPFASRDRNMQSNLLFRGKDNGLGYAWMEFYDGQQYLTLGVGMRTNRHVTKVPRWYFVTAGRVGVDFGLIDKDDRVLNRKDFQAQFDAPVDTQNQDEYRHKVNNALFQLDPDRYAQMIELILTLRRPQLAKELNPESLSRTLSDGLRPLDDGLIADAAKSFEDMEAVAATLTDLRNADDKVAGFLTHYTTYVRSQAKQAVAAVDVRMQDVNNALRAETDTDTKMRQQYAAEQQQRSIVEELDGRLATLNGELTGLRDSEAYKSRQNLDDARKSVESAKKLADTTADQAKRSRDDLATARQKLHNLADSTAQSEKRLDNLASAARQSAEYAGIDWQYDTEPSSLHTHSESVITQRRTDIAAVDTAITALERASAERQRAEQAAEYAEAEHQTAQTEAEEALAETERQREALSTAVEGWAATYHDVLTIDLGDTITEWVREATSDTARSLREAVTSETQPVCDTITRQRAGLSAQLEGLEAEVARHQEEYRRIDAQRDDAPPRPRWRGHQRDVSHQSPLWTLVRFKSGVSDVEGAAVEAALEAAGILDSLVGPVGDELDSSLRAVVDSTRPDGKTLADFLECEEGVEITTVQSILRSIAVRDRADSGNADLVAIDLRGRFAQGAVAGRAAKNMPEFVGATARQRRRQQRLAELGETIAALEAQAGQLREAITLADGHHKAIGEAVEALPATSALSRALHTVDRKETVVAERARAIESAQSVLRTSVDAERQARQDLQFTEKQHGLRAVNRAAVRQHLGDFQEQVREIVAALKELRDAKAAVSEQEQLVGELQDSFESTEMAASEAGGEHAQLRARFDAIENAMDGATATIFERVQAAQHQVERTRREHSRASEDWQKARDGKVRAEEKHNSAKEQTVNAIGEAREASHGLRPFAVEGLLRILNCPRHLRWPDSAVTDGQVLAPAVDELLVALRHATRDVSPSEASVKSAATRVNNAINEISTQLPATGMDHHVQWDNASGVLTVNIDTDEGRRDISDYAEWIHAQRTEQEVLLTEREQHVLEDALLTSLTSQIHQRMLESRDLVTEMDKVMGQRRTSSGIRLSVSWVLSPHLTAQEREIFKLFDGAPGHISTRMTQIRRYFIDRIKQRRAEVKTEATYRDLLREVLDYRDWRVFEFTLWREDKPTKLTKRVHSQLSGGEQSVTLHLPLFAAANAVFSSAGERAPRMIALDEAFAGVDENGRDELMGLAAKFDLQLIMTGYDLFATVPEVSGAAHYSLNHDEANQVVSTILMVWNGTTEDEVVDYDGSLVKALGSPNTRVAPEGGQ